MVPSILVLGLGNDLLKDDGVGIEAARRLRTSLGDSIECIESPESGLALMDYLVGRDKAVIIDAVLMGPGESGKVFEWSLDELGQASTFSPHYVGLCEIRDFAMQLGLPFPDEVKVFGVAVRDPFTIGEKMSPQVEAALGSLIERVRSVIHDWLRGADE